MRCAASGHNKTMMNPSDIAWSLNQFNLLNPNGGVWMIPRSGLMFTRRDKELHLTARMPWCEEMAAAHAAGSDVPKNSEQLLKYQQQDFHIIASHFKAAGISVINSVD